MEANLHQIGKSKGKHLYFDGEPEEKNDLGVRDEPGEVNKLIEREKKNQYYKLETMK